MKKLKIFVILLLLGSSVAFFGFRMYQGAIADNVPPQVTCDSEEIVVPVDITEEELIAGVTAIDKRDGDVSNTIVIENISDFFEEGKRAVTYVAVDKSMNVGRAEQIIVYEGYKEPKFKLSSPLSFAVGRSVLFEDFITAKSVIDGDLTEKIKYNLETTINTMNPGSYPIEYRVSDSAGKTVYLQTEVEIYDAEYNGIQVELDEYLVYLEAGDKFDPEDYYKGASSEGQLSIKSGVKRNVPGTYFVDYIVKGPVLKGRSRLTVVVEEK